MISVSADGKNIYILPRGQRGGGPEGLLVLRRMVDTARVKKVEDLGR